MKENRAYATAVWFMETYSISPQKAKLAIAELPCQQDMDDTLFPQGAAADQSINKDQRIKAEWLGGSHNPGQEEERWEVCRCRLVSPVADCTCPATNSAPLLPGSSNNSFYNPLQTSRFLFINQCLCTKLGAFIGCVSLYNDLPGHGAMSRTCEEGTTTRT